MALRVSLVNPDGISLTDGDSLLVGLDLVEIGVELTRPADTNSYAANDVVANATSNASVLQLANVVALNGAGGYISKFRLFTNSASAMLGAQVRVHVYNAAPTATNDNSPFALLYANAVSRIGYIDLPALATEGAGSDSSYALWSDMPLKFHCAAASKSLWIVPELKVAGANPASGQKLYFFAGIERH